MSLLFGKFELILIDDGSSDLTKNIIKRLSHEYPEHIRTIYHEKNLGVGRGIKHGINKASMTYVMTNFSDLPFDIDDLKYIMPLMHEQHADGCVVVRANREAHTFFRKVTSLVNYIIIKVLFRVPFDDFQFVQLYKRDLVLQLKIDARDVFVPPEIIIKLHDSGANLIQYKTTFHARKAGKSKYYKLKYFIHTFLDQLRFFIKIRLLNKHDQKKL